jgi:hypothetical protein
MGVPSWKSSVFPICSCADWILESFLPGFSKSSIAALREYENRGESSATSLTSGARAPARNEKKNRARMRIGGNTEADTYLLIEAPPDFKRTVCWDDQVK